MNGSRKTDLAFADYRDAPGLNYSVLKHARTSMLHAHYAAFHPSPDTKAQRWGRLVHLAILEPLRAWGSLSVWRGEDKRGKEWASFKAACPFGSEIVDADELAELQATSDAVHRNADAHNLIVQSEHEVSLFWDGPEYGPAKARLDGLCGACWFDIKTSRQIVPEAFARQFLALGYDLQVGWYTEGLRASGVTDAQAMTICVQNAPPYDVALYQSPAVMVNRARDEAVKLAAFLRECDRRGAWPGVSPRPQILPLPGWYGERGPDIADDDAEEG